MPGLVQETRLDVVGAFDEVGSEWVAVGKTLKGGVHEAGVAEVVKTD